jgi:hypothetical protein
MLRSKPTKRIQLPPILDSQSKDLFCTSFR